MKLSYRGTSYEYNPVNTVNTESPKPLVDLKYRGASYRRNQAAGVQRLSALFKYRGVAYNQHSSVEPPSETTSTTPVPQVALSVEEKARLLNLNHNREIRNRHRVMLARLAAEVGVSGSVAEQWDDSSSAWDSSTWAGYDRSHVALS